MGNPLVIAGWLATLVTCNAQLHYCAIWEMVIFFKMLPYPLVCDLFFHSQVPIERQHTSPPPCISANTRFWYKALYGFSNVRTFVNNSFCLFADCMGQKLPCSQSFSFLSCTLLARDFLFLETILFTPSEAMKWGRHNLQHCRSLSLLLCLHIVKQLFEFGQHSVRLHQKQHRTF